MPVRIGVDSLVYALLTADAGIALPTYGAVKLAPGVMALGINPNASNGTLFADDGPMETATTLGEIEVEIEKAQLSSSEKADLLGHLIDNNGGIVYGANDVPPWVAIGFRTLQSDGTYKYVWLYKGKFMEPEENNETKGDNINFQTDKIVGKFAKTNYAFNIDAAGVKKQIWKYDINSADAGVDAPTIAGWFTAVTFPSEAI